MLFNAGMQTIDEVRRLNLELAIRRMGSAAKLADAAKTSPAYISQIKNRTPDSKTGTPKTMGDDMARRIELALGVQAGWMDTPHADSVTATTQERPSGLVTRNLIWLVGTNNSSAYELQKATGIPQPVINRILSGETTDPRDQTLRPLAGHFGLSVADLRDRDLPAEATGTARVSREGSNVTFARAEIVDENDPRLIHVPKVRLRVAAGISGFQADPERFDGATMTVNRQWAERQGLNPDQLLWIRVSGRSMEKTLYEDDWVLVDLTSTEPKDSKIFVVNFGGEAIIKRLTRDNGRWWLTSDNPDPQFYRRECQGDDCIIVGQAVLKHSQAL